MTNLEDSLCGLRLGLVTVTVRAAVAPTDRARDGQRDTSSSPNQLHSGHLRSPT